MDPQTGRPDRRTESATAGRDATANPVKKKPASGVRQEATAKQAAGKQAAKKAAAARAVTKKEPLKRSAVPRAQADADIKPAKVAKPDDGKFPKVKRTPKAAAAPKVRKRA